MCFSRRPFHHLGAAFFLAVIAGHSATAAQPPSGQGSLPVLPASDPTSIWTLTDENASISTGDLTDRYYVNGLRLSYTSGTGQTPSTLQTLGDMIFGIGQQRFTIDVTQQIFTAADTESYDPPLDDRPYAGVLLATLGVVHDTLDTRNIASFGAGVLGPSALAQTVQNGFHTIIGQAHTNGWNTQLHDQPVFQITDQMVWRIPTGQVAGVDTDILPAASVGLGLLRVYAQAGGQIRFGQGLDSDFGVVRIQPGSTGGDAFQPTRPFVWYVFAGVDGKAVGYDVTLNGNTWQDSRGVTVTPLVGEFQGGLAVMAWGTRLSYTQVFQTQEFKHQEGGLHQLGALALSVRF